MTSTNEQAQLDADWTAMDTHMQSISPFYFQLDGHNVSAQKFISPDTLAMQEAGYLRRNSFNVAVRFSALSTTGPTGQSVSLPVPNVKMEVLAPDAATGELKPFTVSSVTMTPDGVGFEMLLEIKL